jgi:hypothetical protein
MRRHHRGGGVAVVEARSHDADARYRQGTAEQRVRSIGAGLRGLLDDGQGVVAGPRELDNRSEAAGERGGGEESAARADDRDHPSRSWPRVLPAHETLETPDVSDTQPAGMPVRKVILRRAVGRPEIRLPVGVE